MPAPRLDPFHAVADPTRRALLDRLRRGEAPVAELTAGLADAGFRLSRPAVSKHLRVLREARLVRERRGGDDGRQRVYTLTPAPLGEVARWALAYQAFWESNLAGLKRHFERSPEPSLPPRSDHADPPPPGAS
ncbi:transcriptional regulator [Gemmatimonadetes bacterium T265]|nr:transcriptional regulator [Gemmatimonadetes bacterium T265]